MALGTELLGMTRRQWCLLGELFPCISHCRPSGCCVARTLGVPGVKRKWIPTYPASEPVWGLHSVCLLAPFQQTHHLIHSRACLQSWWLLLLPLPSPLIPFPRAAFTEVLIALDLTGLYQCRGYLITLKRMGKKICSVCYQGSDIMSSSHSSIDHAAG